jgi:hypothetical protein
LPRGIDRYCESLTELTQEPRRKSLPVLCFVHALLFAARTLPYSYRSASIGLTRDAFLAGTYPAAMAVAVSTSTAPATTAAS